MPRSGLSARFEMPTLAFISSRSNTAVPVVSLPVPLVVGTEISIRCHAHIEFHLNLMFGVFGKAI